MGALGLPPGHEATDAYAVKVAKILAESAGSSVRVSGTKTRGAQGKGQGTMARRVAKGAGRPRSVASACRECGVVLEEPERQYCQDCVPTLNRERTRKLLTAGRNVLAEMRASPDDPARSAAAVAKRVATNAERRKTALEWEKRNPGPHDREVFRTEILPGLQKVTLPQMMRATGLTSGYCWRLKRGERTPHPVYWKQLRDLGAQVQGLLELAVSQDTATADVENRL